MEYLSNPLQTGVYYSQFLVDFSELNKLLIDVAAKSKKTKESKDLNETADKLKRISYLNSDEIIKAFVKAITSLANSEDCQKEITEYFFGKSEKKRALFYDTSPFFTTYRDALHRPISISKKDFFSLDIPLRPLPVFKSRILRDINDVLVIESEETNKRTEMSFAVTSITEEGTKRFTDFIKCVPHIGDKVKDIRSRKTFSSRYTFRPYPLAVRLWLESENAIAVPEDLRDFLKGSMRYHSEEEWRTSIVLSAIAVESVLADLYEEKHKVYAPNVPLGDLYHKVKDKITFPSEIMKAIEMVNEARISAVHRSRFPVSDREATNALYGSTTFIMWYSESF